ncbi:hypothetical protein FRC12_020167 [Ceratobasidium sp. 428]|nr:hypothetical protein FRC12_020167 [Ceratobasidium sp. 428]
MQQGGRLRNDTAPRALRGELEEELFGPGGCDELIVGVVRDVPGGNSVRCDENNNTGSGDVSPNTQKQIKTQPVKKTLPVKKKKMPQGLIIASRGAVASVSPSRPANPKGSNNISLESDTSAVGEVDATGAHNSPPAAITAWVTEETHTLPSLYSPTSQSSTIASTFPFLILDSVRALRGPND